MAFTLKLGNVCIKNGCKSILLSDGTGTYDAILNLTGWGAPNITIGSVTSTNIIITLPDGITVVNILNPAGLPVGDTSLQYEITSLVVNGGTSIADGLYQIEYTVVSGGITYTTGKIYKLFTCNLDCCVSKMSAKIATETDCNCNSSVITNAIYARALLDGLIANEECGNITDMTKLITKLNAICNLTNSNCGCN